MLWVESFGQSVRAGEASETHNHIIVGCLDWDWIGGCRGPLSISTRQDWVDLDQETLVSVPSRGLEVYRRV